MKVYVVAGACLLGVSLPMTATAAVAEKAAGANDAVAYRAAGAWVVDPPAGTDTAGAPDAPVRMRYFDTQVHVSADGTEETYTAYRLKILKPEALGVGNVALTWQPEAGPMAVHHVRLIRDGRTTDVLATTKFTVLQREQQLEQSMLTGLRTATLQVPGLQVGDELAIAATVTRREAAFGGHVAGQMQMPLIGTPGAYRFRLLSPHGRAILATGTSDLPALKPVPFAGGDLIDVTLTDPKGAVPTEGAPLRYNVRRLIEYSDFGSWADVSRRIAPLFERAARLAPGSPVKAEAEKIAARTSDQTERAQAALQLVEERIRYVFVALNGGNYVPASAEETWERRFGDCKAKSVLLAALLRALGIDAQVVLVNSGGGDGIDARLPGPRSFGHVIVRAVIGGGVRWLDATRAGDRYLDNLPAPFRWALPLSPAGATIERIEPRDPGFPALTSIVDIDATGGADRDARVSMRNIVRGDEAYAIRTQLAGLPADDANRALRSYWREQADWVTPDKVAWRYDERRMAVLLDVQGRGNPGWKGEGGEGRTLSIPGAGFYPPDRMRRPAEQDQTAGWSVPYPRFKCWATTIRLPRATGPYAWSLYAEPMNRTLGGFGYWRASGLSGTVVRTVMSTRSYEAEATPAEAEINNRAIPGFNNNQSSISEEKEPRKAATRLPFGDNADWLNGPITCSPQ